MKKSKIHLSSIIISKILAVLYVIARLAASPMGYVNGIVLLLLLILLLVATLIEDNWKLQFTSFFNLELVFIVITVGTSMLIARDKSLVIDSALSMAYGLIFGYCIFRICLKERSIDLFACCLIISGLILSMNIILRGGFSSGRIVRLTLNENTNSNTIGVFFTLCIWGTVYWLTKHEMKVYRLIAATVNIALLLYCIIATASRKSFIATLLILTFSVIFVLRPYFRKYSLSQKIILILSLVFVIGFIIYRYGSLFRSVSLSLSTRMGMLGDESISENHRFELIRDALKVFIQHPVVGVGWNNYRLFSFSSQYSHCTYVELLACSGAIGGILGYWLILKMVADVRRLKQSKVDLFNAITLLSAFAFICSVQIVYYNTVLLMAFHILYAYCHIYDKSEKSEVTGVI